MTRSLTPREKLVFGETARIHPATDMCVQDGIGALSDDEQAIGHLDVLKKDRDKLQAQVDDYDREIATPETDPRKVPELKRRRVAAAGDLAAADKRFRDVQLALLDDGTFERCRGKTFATNLRTRLENSK